MDSCPSGTRSQTKLSPPEVAFGCGVFSQQKKTNYYIALRTNGKICHELENNNQIFVLKRSCNKYPVDYLIGKWGKEDEEINCSTHSIPRKIKLDNTEKAFDTTVRT